MNDFEYSRNLHHYETDSDGVCHFSNYLRIFEEGFADALRSVMAGKAQVGHSFAVIEAHSKYHYPIRYGDSFKVKFSFSEVKRSFFSAVAHVYANEQICAEITGKFAAVSAVDNKSMALDIELRKALSQLQIERKNESQ